MSNTSSQNITRDNHYIPEFLLRNWAPDGKTVFAYRILVSSPTVPEWQPKSTRSVAFHEDLYTVFSGGQEVDEFEQWIERAFESPGAIAAQKLMTGNRLHPHDWRSIIRLVALQDIRTPQGFLELRSRWNRVIPQALDVGIRDAIAELHAAHASGKPLQIPATEPTGVGRLIDVTIQRPEEPTSDKARIHVSVPSGRALWIESVRNLMGCAANVLCQHRWSVAQPFGEAEWPLTDHPVLRVNYNNENDYTFEGGWNSPGSEIMMPLSPRHLLYAKVGAKMPNRFTLSANATELVQRLLAERAHRWIFATTPQEWVSRVRPRIIDAAAVVAEEQAWKNWHQDQLASEVELDSRTREHRHI